MVNDSSGNQDVQEALHLSAGSTVRSYLELVRLPNIFTAMADVAMGFLFVRAVATWRDVWTLVTLLAASSLLYLGGVVLNDVFDVELDRQERPERVLPSRRVSVAAANRLGWTLLWLGVILGSAVVFLTGHFRTGIVAAVLAACIVLYDAWLKRTPIGPVAMGTCRMLNVLLGMNAVDAALRLDNWLVAGAIGVYVMGVTWFARREARTSSRLQLSLATVVMAVGIAMLAWFPHWSQRTIRAVHADPQGWYFLTGAIGLLIVWRCFWAVIEPIPVRIRMAVAQCVLSIVMLDAVACYAVRGVPWATMILALLLPALFLGRWIRVT